MWRLLNFKLPFSDVLQDIGFALPSKCVFCPHEDSLLHFFYHCPVAASLWSHFARCLGQPFSFPSLWHLLQSWWQSADKHNRIELFLPSIFCWELWKADNSTFYEGTIKSPASLRQAVISQLHLQVQAWQCSRVEAASLYSNLIKVAHFRPCQPYCFQVSWTAPPPTVFKLNTDGSLLNRSIGGGMIIRDSHGGLVAARSVYFGAGTSFEAEARALLHGLRLCHSLDLSSVIVESDSKALVDSLSGCTALPWKYNALLRQIQLLLHPNLTIRHIYREANFVADYFLCPDFLLKNLNLNPFSEVNPISSSSERSERT